MLLTQHFRDTDPATGCLLGPASDQQISYARTLIHDTGRQCDLVDLPDATHALHATDPRLFAQTVLDWTTTLEPAVG